MGCTADQMVIIVTKVDERQVQFSSDRERWIANWLVLNGKADRATPLTRGTSRRNPDARVELHVGGTVQTVDVEFKSLDPGSDQFSLWNRLTDSLKRGGQARYIVFDVTQTGMTSSEANAFLTQVAQQMAAGNITPAQLQYILIIGDGFTLEKTFP